MSAVRFALGSKPVLTSGQASNLADLLAHGHNLAALSLAGRIQARAELRPNQPLANVDLELNRSELEELAAVFTDARDLLREPAFAHLNSAVLDRLAARG